MLPLFYVGSWGTHHDLFEPTGILVGQASVHLGFSDTSDFGKAFQGIVSTESPARSENLHLEFTHIAKRLRDLGRAVVWIDIQSHSDMPFLDAGDAVGGEDGLMRVHCKRPGGQIGGMGLECILTVQYRVGFGMESARCEADVRMYV